MFYVFPWENKEPHGLEAKGTLRNLVEILGSTDATRSRQAHGCSMLSLNDIHLAGRVGWRSTEIICRAIFFCRLFRCGPQDLIFDIVIIDSCYAMLYKNIQIM